ncbi:MAG: M56 family metallopeptidase [Proteobacteria bacterium]|nr:M56 family metallopeptidase [Pseudomonadota bacterium]
MDPAASYPPGLVSALALALLHSLWQAALLGLVARCALGLMAQSSAARRHGVALAFLLAMVISPVLGVVSVCSLSIEQLQQFQQTWLPGATTGRWEALFQMPIYWITRAAPFPDAIVLLWLLGAALMLLCHMAGLYTVAQMVRAPHDVLPPHWQARVCKLRVVLGVTQRVVVQVSREVLVPCTARLVRPVIWLPASLLARMPSAQLEALLAHELAHIARKDWLWNGLQCLCEALLFFHPAAWWLGRRIRQEREHAADDLAVAACGDAIALAEALATVVSRCPAPSLVLAAHGGLLVKRIARLLTVPSVPEGGFGCVALGAVLVGGVLVATPVGLAGAQRHAGIHALPNLPKPPESTTLPKPPSPPRLHRLSRPLPLPELPKPPKPPRMIAVPESAAV